LSHRSTAKRIGLFGGSFDPPHIGHVALVDEALAHLPLDELRVVPVGQPVHRELSGRVTAKQRLAWMGALFAGKPHVSVWDWEVRRRQPTATIDTLQQLAESEPDARILLLLGGDALAGMERWRGYPRHQALCDVAVFMRQGVPRPRLAGWQEISAAAWREEPGCGRVIYLDVELPDVSATGLRARLESGKAIPPELPGPVADEVAAAYRLAEMGKTKTGKN